MTAQPQHAVKPLTQHTARTTHQLDVTLISAPQTTTALTSPIPMLKLSLITGEAEPLVKPQESSTSQDITSDLLVLGGKVVEAITQLDITRSATLSGLPYWFTIKCGIEEVISGSESEVVLSTYSEDSPCNQSVFMLRQPLEVVEGEEGVVLQVVWRDGVFSATLDRCNDGN
ncbi:hypothetical protein GWK47_046852 [Chionoecetes opilio]|uniref:Uncharacterized protein n=1 Tax=Chionoecetes opilio TaxID=41210 RepID=A0A8J4YE87_CHIOP|nr:hypothetical protein GWK47_046852 [Chionoecetes opilio]